jgi:hypothetical protein
MSLLRQHPQREGETNAEYSARLDAIWKASPAGQGLSRLDDLRSLRASVGRTADAFIREQGGDPAAMDRAEAEARAAEQVRREQAFEAREQARRAADRARAERLDTLHVSDMTPEELRIWERQHGLFSRR